MGDNPKCCFCLELRTGAFVFGYLSLVWNLVISLFFILVLIGAVYIMIASVIAIVAVMLGLSLLRLISIILVLFGLHTNNRKLINAFLVSHFIFILLGAALFIAGMVLGIGALFRTISALEVFFSCYFMIVIRMYSSKMDNSVAKPVTQQYAMQQQQPYGMQQWQPYATQQQPYAMQQQQPYAMPQQSYAMQQQPYAMQQLQPYAMQQQR